MRPMLLFVAIGLAFTFQTRVAGADSNKEPPDERVIPNGHGWYCYEWFNPDHATQSLGMCGRDAKTCEGMRGETSRRSPSQTVTPCAMQPNASVVTFHDRMKDNWQYAATPQTRQCEAMRGWLAKNPDNDHVTDCAVIGDRVALADPRPARGEPPADAVPAGFGWWCAPWSREGFQTMICGRNACPSSMSHPEQFDDKQCRTQPTAWVTVYFDKTNSMWWHRAGATAQDCAKERDALLARTDIDSVTACKVTGDYVPPPAPFHPEALSPGKTWWCPQKRRPGVSRISSLACARRLDFCEQDNPSFECEEQAEVFAVTFRSVPASPFEALKYKSAAVCEDQRLHHLVMNTSELSACTRIGAVRRPSIDQAPLAP